MRKWKIYVIHHSHTDVGYTDRQEKIEKNHIDYINQAIAIFEEIRSGKRKEWQGFKWTCESFWAVERFLEQAEPGIRQSFERLLQSGDIELSGSYLNLSELIDFDVLKTMTGKAVAYGKSIGIQVNSAMTADINGYSWGFARCLADLGIENLFSCVHTHHGMFPIGRKQIPFWWETPDNNRILVWIGDHYQLANEFGIAPGALMSYTIKDEFSPTPMASNHWEIAETRITRYLQQLEKEGYPYDFVPVMVSGLVTDNAPPSGSIMDFINRWNAWHGDEINIEMTTVSSFFTHLRKQEVEIPVYSGDWPDWWADGVASTAVPTKVFREAQRILRAVKRLDPENTIVDQQGIAAVEYNLMLYAEHTWGHWASALEPWDATVQSLEFRTSLFAYQAHQAVFKCLDRILAAKGEVSVFPGRPFLYQVINPGSSQVEDIAWLNLDRWEIPLFQDGLEVIDSSSGAVIPHQLYNSNQAKGTQICVPVHLNPGEEKKLLIRPSETTGFKTVTNHQGPGTDGVLDVKSLWNCNENKRTIATESSLETPFVMIRWEESRGIVSWVDKASGKELLRDDRKHNAFTPVYEVTPFDDSDPIMGTRKKMGRNRKRINVSRSTGRLTGVNVITDGPLFAVIELKYDTPGTSYFSLVLTAYADFSRVDLAVRMNKDNVWEPENVYLALPFCVGTRNESETWIEKTGVVLRPRIDQLPGTGTDFYCVQEGIAHICREGGLIIAMPDTPLVQMGPLEFGERQLMGNNRLEDDGGHLYSWILNNFWETNFKISAGGFYEFKYSVCWGHELSRSGAAIQKCHDVNMGLICIRVME